MGCGISFGSCGCRQGGGGGIIPPGWPPPWGEPPPTTGGGVESMEVIWQWKGPGLGDGNHQEVIRFSNAQPKSGGPFPFQTSRDWSGIISTATGKTKIRVKIRFDTDKALISAQNTTIFPFALGFNALSNDYVYDLGPGPQSRAVAFTVVGGAIVSPGAGNQPNIGESWGIHIAWE